MRTVTQNITHSFVALVLDATVVTASAISVCASVLWALAQGPCYLYASGDHAIQHFIAEAGFAEARPNHNVSYSSL